MFLNSYEYIFGIYASKDDRKVLKKIENVKKSLGNYVNINNGIVTGNDKKYLSTHKIGNTYKKALRGKNISRYGFLKAEEYVNYEKTELLRARNEDIFKSKEKLIMQMININFVITYDDSQFYNLGTTYAMTLKNKGSILNILGILNSKLIGFYYKKKFTNDSSLTNAISTQNLVTIPIPVSFSSNFGSVIKNILSLEKELFFTLDKLRVLLQSKFSLSKLSKKLQNWHILGFGDFLKELKKQKIQLTLSEEAEWMQYYNEQREKAQTIKSEIDKTDKEIDQMVYELYGLSEEEIKIVEDKV